MNDGCLAMTYKYFLIKTRTTTVHCKSEASLRHITELTHQNGAAANTQHSFNIKESHTMLSSRVAGLYFTLKHL